MERVVDRLIVSVGARVDRGSIRDGQQAMGGLALAVGAAIAATAAYTVSTAAAMDEIAKTSRALSITTEEYTRLTFAADRSGVSQEKLGAGLRSIQAQLAGVAAGSKEAEGNFQRMGLSVRDADGELKTAAQLLPEIADAFGALSEGDRAAALPRLMGESGAALTTLLLEGSDGIAALGDRAAELGIVLGSDTARNAEALTDSVTDLKAAASGLGMAVVEQVMPPLTVLVDQMTDFLTASDGIVQVGLPRIARAIGAAFEFAATPTGKFTGGLIGAVTALGAVSAGSGLLGALSAASPMLGAFGGGMAATAGKAGLLGLAIVTVGAMIDDMVVTAKGGDSMIRRLADSMGVGEETASTFAGAGEMITEAWGAVPGVIGLVDVVMRSLSESLSPLLDLLGPLGDQIRDVLDSISLGGAITSIGDQFRDAASGYRQLAGFIAGDPSVQMDGAAFDPTNFGGGMGFLPEVGASILTGAAGAGRRQSAIDEYARLSAQPVDVSVMVTSSQSPAERAREVGRQTEQQVRQALAATEAL